MKSYTPKVLKAAKDIRKIVNGLTLSELAALKEAPEGENPIDPLAGVREPRNPRPPEDKGSVAL